MISYSIVISVCNQVETLRPALECLRRQIKNPKAFEVIIADDCSSDGTEEFVRRLRYPIFLKYSRSDSTQGRAINRNRGYQKAAGQWIIFLDGDMVPEPDFIDSYLKSWEQFPDSVVIGSWKLPGELKINRWHEYFISRGRLTMSHGDLVPGKYFTSGNFAIRKTLLDHFCGFDTSFEGWGGEDTDFGFKLEHESIPIHYIPRACCYHYHQKTLSQTLDEYQKFGMGGFPLLNEKYPEKVIFDKGWLLGLPGPGYTLSRKMISVLLFPLRAAPTLALLSRLARIKGGALFSDSMFDWLFYGYLARGYRHRPK
jgi:glycosyltransferase involved in cell wall biosynthesis